MSRYPFAPDFRRQLAAWSWTIQCRMQAGEDFVVELDVALELCAVGSELGWVMVS